ncbi:unnamed protein product [Effrenium voratum]|nr:unnamed protein product [Effrenium voratum]
MADGSVWVFALREKRDCKVEHRFPHASHGALSAVRGFVMAVEKSRTGKSEMVAFNLSHSGKSPGFFAHRVAEKWPTFARLGLPAMEAKVEKLVAETSRDVLERLELPGKRKVLPPLTDSRLRRLPLA